MSVHYWLMKSEPDAFSLEDLRNRPGQISPWDGVRNYQARNIMRDEMKVGDGVIFYHSRIQPPAAVGLARVVREGYPDHTQFDPNSKYYDPKSRSEAPRWFMVDVRFEVELPRPVTLPEMRAAAALSKMALLQKGNRLSVQPVTLEQWCTVVQMGGLDPSEYC